MKKIPTVFRRDPDDMRRVLPEVTPGCEWVLAGEGTATRKYDGTCVMYDGTDWWGRREVKPGKTPPLGWIEVDTDETTGKRVGWQPIEQSPFVKFWRKATDPEDGPPLKFDVGTYELVGPKINGNPERLPFHSLVLHDDAQWIKPFSLTFEGLRETVQILADREGFEGIVWHHSDGRMAKLKARDFPASPTSPGTRATDEEGGR